MTNVWSSIKQAPWYHLLENPRKRLALFGLSEAKVKEIDDEFDRIFSTTGQQQPNWWNWGNYNGQSCVKCGRERMLVSEDNSGLERVFCDSCFWEPAANEYLNRDE
jgi:hypothetical protein